LKTYANSIVTYQNTKAFTHKRVNFSTSFKQLYSALISQKIDSVNILKAETLEKMKALTLKSANAFMSEAKINYLIKNLKI
jgi:hypothetical protein